jgi:peroxidase
MFKTGLSSMHTAWMREHNRLVRKLAELNPHWNDERLFHGMSKNNNEIIDSLN